MSSDNFHNLPSEILAIICLELPTSSLKEFSLVDRRCRALSLPILFRTVHVSFSTRGLNEFYSFAHSGLASQVRVLCYDVSEIIDPLVQHWDYFTTCIYTPQEYSRDQREFGWGLREKAFSYRSIHSGFLDLIESQQRALVDRQDIQVLCNCVQRLVRLTTIRLSFSEPDRSQLLWFSSRVFLDWEYSFPVHLEAILCCIQSAQSQGIRVSSLEITGFYASITNVALVDLATAALSDIKHLYLYDSVNLLSWLADIPLPSLMEVEIGHCWIVGCDLHMFREKHDPDCTKLSLQDVQLYGHCEGNPCVIY
ncbi:unnamed protein product [Penicillium olsonii]|nr:unnamed protein product [Penicillium olsonii]CAG8119710.1 unnamed protein product [Penicillium olsonii]